MLSEQEQKALFERYGENAPVSSKEVRTFFNNEVNLGNELPPIIYGALQTLLIQDMGNGKNPKKQDRSRGKNRRKKRPGSRKS